MARTPKTKPFAVRIPLVLMRWVEEYALSHGMTKTAVLEEALRVMKASADRKRQKMVQQELMQTLRGES